MRKVEAPQTDYLSLNFLLPKRKAEKVHNPAGETILSFKLWILDFFFPLRLVFSLKEPIVSGCRRLVSFSCFELYINGLIQYELFHVWLHLWGAFMPLGCSCRLFFFTAA